MNTEYFENKTTKLLSEICKENGCPNTDVKIRLDQLTFFNPSNKGDWLTFYFDGDKWMTGTRSRSPWNGKILDGLNKCFKTGIECLMKMLDFDKRQELLTKKRSHISLLKSM